MNENLTVDAELNRRNCLVILYNSTAFQTNNSASSTMVFETVVSDRNVMDTRFIAVNFL